jgi:hypothetical protein
MTGLISLNAIQMADAEEYSCYILSEFQGDGVLYFKFYVDRGQLFVVSKTGRLGLYSVELGEDCVVVQQLNLTETIFPASENEMDSDNRSKGALVYCKDNQAIIMRDYRDVNQAGFGIPIVVVDTRSCDINYTIEHDETELAAINLI